MMTTTTTPRRQVVTSFYRSKRKRQQQHTHLVVELAANNDQQRIQTLVVQPAVNIVLAASSISWMMMTTTHRQAVPTLFQSQKNGPQQPLSNQVLSTNTNTVAPRIARPPGILFVFVFVRVEYLRSLYHWRYNFLRVLEILFCDTKITSILEENIPII